MKRRVLGLSCGNADGNAEVLLKAALMAAEAGGAEVRVLRLDDLALPLNGASPGVRTAPDDVDWFVEQLLESEAFIVSAPIYSRSAPGKLRLLADRALGPNADAAFVEELLRMARDDEPVPVSFRADPRVLRPRVAGFISVGGALPERWRSLVLPLMHSLTFSMQIAVVDQMQVTGAGMPRSVVLDEVALERAARLGRGVAAQIGRTFEEVSYMGAPGLCPLCHLDVVVVRPDHVACATCGARGELVVEGGAPVIRFPDRWLAESVLTMAEKRAHFAEVQATAAHLRSRAADIEARAAAYAAFDRRIQPRPATAGS